MLLALDFSTLLASALASGLAGSAHCLAMCGGIASTLGLGARHRQFLWFYHLGRLVSYALLGLVLGSLLPLLGVRAALPSWWRGARLLAALVMMVVGLGILWRHPFRRLERYGFRLWKPIAAALRAFLPVACASDAFLVGLCWGLLPCGLIYAALALALATAQPLKAMAVMLVFGLGTLPAMLGITFFSATWVKVLLHQYGRVALGATVMALGLWSLAEVF